MTSNVYTKNEILQKLAAKGFFVDVYTLDTFFEKWKVEAIFEDEQGCEFYDTNALDLILNNLFNSSNVDNVEEEEQEPRMLKPVQSPIEEEQVKPQQVAFEQPKPQAPYQQPQMQQMAQTQPMPQMQQMPYVQPMPQPMPQPMVQPMPYPQMQQPYPYQQPQVQYFQPAPQRQEYIDAETNRVLNSISLSDGTPLANKVSDNPLDDYTKYEMLEQEAIKEHEPSWRSKLYEQKEELQKEEKKIGILEGALRNSDNDPINEGANTEVPEETPAETGEVTEIDDISLLSESLDAQEKFREYIVSELSKKNMDLTPKNNEFKLDISERTLNMIARSLAKKIAKQVNQIYAADAKASEQLVEVEEQCKLLEEKTKDLEDQNRKLRLLLAESNKNLNSYKPTFFGFYRKVSPKK